MILREIPFNPASNLFSTERDKSRHPGLHVSKIIHNLDVTLNPEKYKNNFDEAQLNTYASLGHVWEQVFTEYYNLAYGEGKSHDIIRPDEVELDGVWMTVDGIDATEMCLLELKSTWRSAGRDIEKDFWAWWVQQKAYCKAWGLMKSRLGVFFVNGYYGDPKSQKNVPCWKMWEATYEQWELDKNWSMLINHARSKGWL